MTRISRNLDLMVDELEDFVARHGYLRSILSIFGLFGLLGIVGQIFGATWLRVGAAMILAVLFVTLLFVSIRINLTLRKKISRTEGMLHGYAKDLHSGHPVAFLECREEMQISENGNADITRIYKIKSSHIGERKYLTFTQIYYGSVDLTARQRSQVEYSVWHARADDDSLGVRVEITSTWNSRRPGIVALTIYAHLGLGVREGDIVTVRWNWPGYSSDLMAGRSPEAFNVVAHASFDMFHYQVMFKLKDSKKIISIRNENVPNLVKHHGPDGLLVEFSEKSLTSGGSFGFVADVS